MTRTEPCEVVITSYLEPELAARIAAAEPRAHVTYEPEFLPTPRYASDHGGTKPSLSPEQLARWETITAGAEVMFDFDWHDPAGILARCPRLRWIQGTSAGIGGFVSRHGLDRGSLEFTTAAGTHAVPLAEFALMASLYFVKGVNHLNAWKAERHWQRYATQRLAGRRALVIGLGGIGRHVATLFSGAGVEVWGLARRTRTEPLPGVTRQILRGDLTEALSATDILIIACPLTEETAGMIGAAELAALPQHAIVVNIGRGPVIDEPALIASLSAGHLAGACLDVFAEEPLPIDSPLWGMDNVIVSPHSASTLADENALLTDLFIDNLQRYLDGRPLRNVYDAVAGY
jgi:glyoxylate/hydroxypyruvate reductase A